MTVDTPIAEQLAAAQKETPFNFDPLISDGLHIPVRHIFAMSRHLSERKLLRVLQCSWYLMKDEDPDDVMICAAFTRDKHGAKLSDNLLMSLARTVRAAKRVFTLHVLEPLAKQGRWVVILDITATEDGIRAAIILAARAKRMDVVELLAKRLPAIEVV